MNEYLNCVTQPVLKALEDALVVQNACNLSGVVFSWARHMQAVCDAANQYGKGTDWKNHHPVNVLFASKVASLTGSEEGLGYYNANEAACDILRANSIEVPA